MHLVHLGEHARHVAHDLQRRRLDSTLRLAEHEHLPLPDPVKRLPGIWYARATFELVSGARSGRRMNSQTSIGVLAISILAEAVRGRPPSYTSPPEPWAITAPISPGHARS